MTVDFLPRPIYAVVGAIGSAIAAILAWIAITPQDINAWLGCVGMTIFTACYCADLVYRYVRRWKWRASQPITADDDDLFSKDMKAR